MFDLTGKKVLITGASGGIGYQIAKDLVEIGAKVIISGTREEKLKDIKSELGDNVEYIVCNLSDHASVEALAAESLEKFDGIDVLVNNAGITSDGLAMRVKTEDWENVINVNLTSCFILTREILKYMMKKKSGKIINITSVVGVSGNPGQASYCASKAGMIGMSKSIAQEAAARGITVNCIAPGFIATEMTDKLNDTQKDAILSNIPAKAMGNPSDISAAVVYLAAKSGDYVNGQTIHVNGGLYMV